jgi:hypothetical protein
LPLKSIIGPSKRRMGNKNLSFHSDFKIVHLFFLKSAPKKVLAKTFLPIENLSQQMRLFGQNLFCCTFYKGSMHIFEISVKKMDF